MHRKISPITRHQEVHRTRQRTKDVGSLLAAESTGQLRKLGSGSPFAHDEFLPVRGGARAHQRRDGWVAQPMQWRGLLHHTGNFRREDFHA